MQNDNSIIQEKLKTTTKQGGIQFLGKTVVYIFSLLFSILLARFFGAEIVLREQTEWVEIVEMGRNKLVGQDEDLY